MDTCLDNDLTHYWSKHRNTGSLIDDRVPSYIYTAQHLQTHQHWQLPRSAIAETLADRCKAKIIKEAIRQAQPDSGVSIPKQKQPKGLYGILLIETPDGEKGVLKAFSGQSNPYPSVNGWVRSLSLDSLMDLFEIQTLRQLDALKAELVSQANAAKRSPNRQAYERLVQDYEAQLRQLKLQHQHSKAQRDRLRTNYQSTLSPNELSLALADLNRQSQRDRGDLRRLKQQRAQSLAPLRQEMDQGVQHRRLLKQEYRERSHQWQTLMQKAYAIRWQQEVEEPFKDYAIDERSLEKYIRKELSSVFPTGFRAATKLLHYATTHQLKPIAMAEFWLNLSDDGPNGEGFDDASPDVCQVLMDVTTLNSPAETHLSEKLCRTNSEPNTRQSHNATTTVLAPIAPLSIHYQDTHLVVVEKPTGLLSVPGRRYRSYDSVISRLRHQLSPCPFLQPVHRLDQGTSGLLVVARSPQAHAALQQQFAQGRVNKIYEALLERPITQTSGTLDLPLWGDPNDRPRQTVNYQRGKPSRTSFQVITPDPKPRVRFTPHTGRTHQIRVHAAQGLDSPLVGDRLYGPSETTAKQPERLHLHATVLQFIHPVTQTPLYFTSPVPF